MLLGFNLFLFRSHGLLGYDLGVLEPFDLELSSLAVFDFGVLDGSIVQCLLILVHFDAIVLLSYNIFLAAKLIFKHVYDILISLAHYLRFVNFWVKAKAHYMFLLEVIIPIEHLISSVDDISLELPVLLLDLLQPELLQLLILLLLLHLGILLMPLSLSLLGFFGHPLLLLRHSAEKVLFDGISLVF